MASRQELEQHIKEQLQVDRFKDYCPNGLQVEGTATIRKLVSGVTASQALIDAAIEQGADALLVHHGYFWKGESAVISGIKRRRVKRLLDHDLNLFAYHLPLDAHPELGNNAQLGHLLNFVHEGTAGDMDILCYGKTQQLMTGEQLASEIETALQRVPQHISAETEIQRVAWCTGAAQSYIEQAVDLGVDAFVSGEISEQTVHIARETGIHYYAAGHHATERYGVQALGQHLAETYGLEHTFIDIDNPV